MHLIINCPACGGSGEKSINKTSDPQDAVTVRCDLCEGEGQLNDDDIEALIANVRTGGYVDEAMAFRALLDNCAKKER